MQTDMSETAKAKQKKSVYIGLRETRTNVLSSDELSENHWKLTYSTWTDTELYELLEVVGHFTLLISPLIFR